MSEKQTASVCDTQGVTHLEDGGNMSSSGEKTGLDEANVPHFPPNRVAKPMSQVQLQLEEHVVTMQSLDQVVKTFRRSDGQPLPRVTLGAVNKDGDYTIHLENMFLLIECA